MSAFLPTSLGENAKKIWKYLKMHTVDFLWSAIKTPVKFIFHCVRRFVTERRMKHKGFIIGDNAADGIWSNDPLDICYVAIDKDFETLIHSIEFAKRNVRHPIANIFVVSTSGSLIENFCKEHDIHFIDESSVTELKKSEIDFNFGGLNRSGWILQQMIKLSVDRFCKSQSILVLDADTMITRPQIFRNKEVLFLSFSDERHIPYREFFSRITGFQYPRISFVSHHALIDVDVLASLKQHIENRCGTHWETALVDNFDRDTMSPMSEYDLYGFFTLNHYDQRLLRLTYWENKSFPRSRLPIVLEALSKTAPRYKSISFHEHF